MATSDLLVSGLGRQNIGKLSERAERLGMTPSEYIRQLVEQDLAISEAARTKSFREILGPGREIVNDEEFDELVERARTAHHLQTKKKRK